MKKIIVIIICILLNSLTFAYAHTEEFDFCEAFENHGSILIITAFNTGDILHANKVVSNFYGQINSYPYIKENKTYLIGIVKNKHENEKSVLINVLFSTIILLLSSSFLIIKNYKKLKVQSDEISNFNELRKTYIDANNSLIYLKDENLKYIFVNKAVMDFYNKKSDEIVGNDVNKLAEIEYAHWSNKIDLEVLEKNTIIIDEKRFKDKVFKSTKFPVKLNSGNYGVGAYVEDVTEAYLSKRKEEKRLLRNQILVDVMNRKFESTQEQLDYALNESLKLTESRFGYIYLYNDGEQEFVLNSWSKAVMTECSVVENLTRYQLEKTGLWGEVVCQRKPIIVNNYEIPNKFKNGYPEGHVKLTKLMSVPLIIDDKIVAVVGLANKEYDYDDYDVYETITLMNGIWNAKERREALTKYRVERNKFLQTLISIGDGVIVVDLDGKVTMLNKVAEELTGWTINEAKGKHYKEVFVLSHENPKLSINDPIEGVLKTDTVQELGNHALLISKHGVKYSLEDSAAPIKDYKGITYGVVLVFRDVTEKKEQRKKIEYLSFHDSLTGLYNRVFLKEELKRLDTERNLPLSIIMGDMNGLKLTNDIFGHTAGDQLLRKAAKVLKKVLRADDIIARAGGDEFTILLPKTNKEEAKKIIERVKEQFSKEKVKAIRGSMSMGCDTKYSVKDDILLIMNNAEKRMYSAKTLDRENIKTSVIETIIGTMHGKSQKEEEHSKNVSKICEDIGRIMGLSDVEIRKLKEAGYLHDIGKIIFKNTLLNKNGNLTDQEKHEMQRHPIVGYRILNSFDGTLDLAETILAHHEEWDGSGYPKGLKGEEIPKLARIISVAENYDEMTNKYNNNPLNKDEAVKELIKLAGKKFDPNIVDFFVKVHKK